MIKNYLITTFRNFVRNQSYTLINILGLSIGITCCIVIFLIVRHDLSFDKFHNNPDQIYRIVHDQTNASGVDYSGVTPYPVASAFRNDFPEIPLVSQFHQEDDVLVKSGSEKFRIEDVVFADSLFFEVFNFNVIEGNPRVELGQKAKAFLTESTAKKFFKGKTEGTFRLENLEDIEIVGVVADPPATSEIQFSMVISYPTLSEGIVGFAIDQWGLNSAGFCYVVLPENISESDVEKRFGDFVKKYYNERNEQQEVYHLQPLSEIHFDRRYNSNSAQTSSLIMLSLLGVFILCIACINFINLATALAVKKSREIGIRKTLGAKRSQLTAYFLGETFILTLFSVLISLCIVEWMLPWLNGFLDKNLGDSLFTDPMLLFFLIVLTVVVTLLSGAYPAIILSGYNPVAVLKNKITSQSGSAGGVRKVLVAFQFIIAQALIIGTLVVADQMSYFKNASLGFAKDAIINVPIPLNDPQLQESFRDRLSANPNIQNLSFSIGGPVSENGFGTNFSLTEQGAQEYGVVLKLADRKYLETYDLKLIAGRWISESEEKLAGPPLDWKDRQYVFVLNESASKQLGFANPEETIGKRVRVGVNNMEALVIGVVQDFHTNSFHKAIEPVVLLNFPHFYLDAGIKINSSNMNETLSFIEKTWNDLYPDYFFEYTFMDEYVETLYRQEERTFTLFKVFAGMSIFIACLGLYGLISFMANQKLKEVGIRKVLGASVSSIVMLFSKEFVKLILLAFIIAAPLSYYFMSEWLNTFAYNVGIGWSTFAIAIFATCFIALVTVSYRAVRAAITNPVDTLRSE